MLLRTRPHPAALLPALSRAFLLVALCGGGVLLLSGRHGTALAAVLSLLLAAAAALGAARALWAVWRWDRTLLAITRDELVLTHGGARRRVMRLPLTAVQRLVVSQGVVGRALGYGTIELAGRGARRGIAYVPRPGEVCNLIARLRG